MQDVKLFYMDREIKGYVCCVLGGGERRREMEMEMKGLVLFLVRGGGGGGDVFEWVREGGKKGGG